GAPNLNPSHQVIQPRSKVWPPDLGLESTDLPVVGNSPRSTSPHPVTHSSNFAVCLSHSSSESWILDSGASDT
ncbi:hypothetical protein A2U01_0022983, partial [Trifolium medium]|nr:hypothetical protein [Trifolium medium]